MNILVPNTIVNLYNSLVMNGLLNRYSAQERAVLARTASRAAIWLFDFEMSPEDIQGEFTNSLAFDTVILEGPTAMEDTEEDIQQALLWQNLASVSLANLRDPLEADPEFDGPLEADPEPEDAESDEKCDFA